MYHINISQDEDFTESHAKRINDHIKYLTWNDPNWAGATFEICTGAEFTGITCDDVDDRLDGQLFDQYSESDEGSIEVVQLFHKINDILRGEE
jgi:hypothetical protein